jgi:aryl-alcohol dehydrogenase-like predicted oxidoreductase
MEKRILGRTHLPVTVLGYGAMELRHLNQSDAGQILNAVLDQGINYIDTSPDYGPSEEYIGNAIARRRSEYFLASKCGCNVDATGKGQNPPHVWSRKQLLWNIDNSLRLLKTDHLDVWQLHGPLPEELPGGVNDEVIRTMQELRQQGKIKWIAISYKNGRAGDPLYPAGYVHQYIKHFLDLGVFDVMQIVYGGMVRKNEIAITETSARGLGTVIRGVVKQYQLNFPDLFARAGLNELCAPGESMSQFMLRFAMNHPGIHTMIIGTHSPAHLAENIHSAEQGKLPESTYREACRRLASIGIQPQDIA